MNSILIGDVCVRLRDLPDRSVHCVVTSPPYWGLRDYGVDGQIGLEELLSDYLSKMVAVFREVRRVLRDDGTLWLNLGDCYANDGKFGGETGGKQAYLPDSDRKCNGRERRRTGLASKNLVGMPWRVAFALQADGWVLRADNIWHKPNCMPSSVKDRPTTSHEYVFLMSKSPRYCYDAEAVSEPVTGNAHARGSGVNPKAKAVGRNSRIHLDRDVQHAGRAAHPRQNESFSAAVAGLVERRNLRTVWRIASHSFKGAHFATFPPRLAEICIKAGTSEHGCCPKCGRPWVRVVEKQRVPTRPGTRSKVRKVSGWAQGPGAHSTIEHNRPESHPKTKQDAVGNRTYTGFNGRWKQQQEFRASARDDSPYHQQNGMIVGNRDPLRHITATVTTGWRQGCDCDPHAPVPCVVLDPFFGAGTTGLMAAHMGRNWIGIEINPDYAALAQERIAAGHTPVKQRRRRESDSNAKQLLLFPEVAGQMVEMESTR